MTSAFLCTSFARSSAKNSTKMVSTEYCNSNSHREKGDGGHEGGGGGVNSKAVGLSVVDCVLESSTASKSASDRQIANSTARAEGDKVHVGVRV